MEVDVKKRILVIDDEDVILFSYKKIFQGRFLDVDVCKTPEAAMEMIRDNVYNAVISDIRLTDSESREGLDILRYVMEHSPGTPVIIMTGYGSTEVKEKALQLGAAYYFDKPIAISVMEDTLKALGLISGES